MSEAKKKRKPHKEEKAEKEGADEKSEKIKALQKQVEEKEELIKRLQADFDNYRKYIERERENIATEAASSMIMDMLPVLDDLEAAVKGEKNSEAKKGFEAILSKALSALKKHGLEPIDAEGKMFDPNMHEAVMKEKSEKEEGTVIEELRKGYLFRGRVIRHSMVKVSG